MLKVSSLRNYQTLQAGRFRHFSTVSNDFKSDICQWNPVAYNDLIVGIPAEQSYQERRVGLTPESASLLLKEGIRVVIERGAGRNADISDSAYETVGVQIADQATVWKSNLVLKVQPPSPDELRLLQNRTIISFIQPAQNAAIMNQLQSQGATAFAMDCIPRMLSRGQAFDALSSQVS